MVLAVRRVVVKHSSEPGWLGDVLDGTGVGHEPGLGGGLGRYVPGWG
jgi:hypothetical protein